MPVKTLSAFGVLMVVSCAAVFSQLAGASKDDGNDVPARKENAAVSQRCSADALPVAERRRMEQEYVRRARIDGKASANAWVIEQGRRFREKLVAAGICPQSGSDSTQVARSSGNSGTSRRNGRSCTFASLSAEAKSRYLSRYKRRIRIDGQAHADRWLHEQVCMTAEQRRALQPKPEGDNCRVVSAPVTSLDGSMTVGMRQECD
ncbi:hypothetical protein ACBY01_15610 [Sphingomonas sp. ac-8]|uniref:hypothetical protein n=1 Tax=Sphingomonas sp. ac-8 TaxID=3242977 RepID=UPI003A81038F